MIYGYCGRVGGKRVSPSDFFRDASWLGLPEFEEIDGEIMSFRGYGGKLAIDCFRVADCKTILSSFCYGDCMVLPPRYIFRGYGFLF